MPRIGRQSAQFLVLLVMCGGAVAQRPIGIPTAVNGRRPQLRSQPLWFGNSSFGYQISNAPGGGSGLLAHSIQRAAVFQSGISLGVSLASNDLIALTPFVTDAAGNSNVSLPITGPFNPSLIGISLYAQAAIADPLSGSLGASKTQLLEVSLRPLMFLVENSLPPLFADPFSGQLIPITPNYSGLPVSARFINGGRDLLMLTTTGIFHCDSMASSFSFTQWTSGPFEGFEWDAIRRRVVSYSPIGGTQVLDGDRSSASFGQILQQYPAPGPMVLSADGTRGLRRNGINFQLVDFDPASPSFGQSILLVPPAQVPGVPAPSEVSISSDGRLGFWAYSSTLPDGNGTHVLDLATGTWIDHNPGLLGVQALGRLSWPTLNPTDNILWRRDHAAGYMLSSPNAPRRIDRNPDDLAQFTITLLPMAPPVAGPIPLFFSELPLSLSTSGRFAVTAVTSVASFPGPRDFYLIELATGTRVPWFQLPTGGLSFITAWR